MFYNPFGISGRILSVLIFCLKKSIFFSKEGLHFSHNLDIIIKLIRGNKMKHVGS